MIDKLKLLCKEKGRNITEFWSKKIKMDKGLHQILDSVMHSTNWKGSKAWLIARIQKIGSQTEFSVRERKLLKELIVKQIENKSDDFSKFEYYFPSKDAAKITKESESSLLLLKIEI